MKNWNIYISAVTATLIARATFFFIDDPEGPNLLIVIALAAFIYIVSFLTTHLLALPASGSKRILLTIFTQVIVAATLFLVSSW